MTGPTTTSTTPSAPLEVSDVVGLLFELHDVLQGGAA
ncbi:hypothetical protein SAMN05421872_102314 [Nocardioides lianchengensis]|uniref:Uncharacterized protein n=1 Tax=Nocardioides lianchengensis TaxID=1045774 RepID=A0A1G6LNV5_9ACTN|nr:hypothetical protein [Nocardioides lianchengensis]SDC44940.1 hypothetical protein SAMN05421872_102314 [Nocardioides lianchengensis]